MDADPAAAKGSQGRMQSITIIDQAGRIVPSGIPSATSQIFDVTVGPSGQRIFSPNTLNINAGDTVRWTWGSDFHSVTSGNSCAADLQFCSPDDMNCASGVLSNTGAVYTHTFAQPGDYSYFCAAHCFSGMTGAIHVSAPALQLNTAVSRKSHGAAGAFDIDLPLSGTAGVECRSGGATNDYTLVVTFSNNVVSGNASVTTGVANVSGSPQFSGNTMTVNLTSVTNQQTITVTLSGVTDQFSQMLPDTPVNMSVLIGDTNGNASVNASDVSQTKGRIGQAVSGSNFRSDVNFNGVINASDTSIVKSHVGEGLPMSPD